MKVVIRKKYMASNRNIDKIHLTEYTTQADYWIGYIHSWFEDRVPEYGDF